MADKTINLEEYSDTRVTATFSAVIIASGEVGAVSNDELVSNVKAYLQKDEHYGPRSNARVTMVNRENMGLPVDKEIATFMIEIFVHTEKVIGGEGDNAPTTIILDPEVTP